MTRILGLALFVTLVVSATASADAPRPRRIAVPMRLPPITPPSTAVNSHTLFLNNCSGGCTIHEGQTNSATDTSDLVDGTKSVAGYPYGTSTWNQVVQCVKQLEAPFNITVTDTRPTSGNYFEVVVAGQACDVLPSGECQDVGGVADYNCTSPGSCFGSYIPNALVFDFAETWGGSVTEDCATIGQEIAHAWNLDHVDLADDPMTYDRLQTPLAYHDNAPCGSDCLYSCSSGVGTCDAFNVPCTNNRHACLSTGTATQNEIQTITGLFGASNAPNPVLTITSPANNSAQPPGFAIDTTCTVSDSSGIQSVSLTIDGGQGPTVTTPPFNFSTNAALPDGPHKFVVTCNAGNLHSASQELDITVGIACTQDSSCPSGYICFNKACIAGSNTPGGLGATCTSNSQCIDGECATGGSQSVCVIGCNLTSGSCPSGFGCVSDG
ncbi:MAG TPA: Ig-like domain-containing protein, partial [Kofleriaceae bacterium]|nr:Ig-like domain-containing protein [Kofleriaceae bacterium]